MEFLAFCGDGNVASGRTTVKVTVKGVRGRLVRRITSLVLISHSEMFFNKYFFGSDLEAQMSMKLIAFPGGSK